MMYQALINKECKLAVLGLGYVGLPLALAFARKMEVIAYDINELKLEMIRQGRDPSSELSAQDFQDKSIEFTNDLALLAQAKFYIVAVPTPIDEYNRPDLSLLLTACHTLGKLLKKGDYVVFESTVYPGCTQEDCLPILEKASGLHLGKDFKLAYSPERINPGDKVHTLVNTVKVVGASDDEALDEVAQVYASIIEAGIFKTSSIQVAEAAKIIENTQRDVNIALMNELSIILGRMKINTFEVLEAAGSKWNFLPFSPGLVGGHCIGVDPYYLIHKANELKYHPQLIGAGRFVNDTMGGYIGKKLVKQLVALKKDLSSAKVLIMGFTFKENVSDIRNTKVIDIIRELGDYGLDIEIIDVHADALEVKKLYSLSLLEKPNKDYDAIVLAVGHDAYLGLEEEAFLAISNPDSVFIDIKGHYRNKIHKMNYWSL